MATMHSATSVEDFDAGDSDILLGRTEQYPWQRWYREPPKMNKKPLYIVAAIVVVLFLSSAMYKTGAYMAADKMPAMSTVPEERIINRLSALNGPPTLKFRGLCFHFQLACLRLMHSMFFSDRQSKPESTLYLFLDRCWLEYVDPDFIRPC